MNDEAQRRVQYISRVIYVVKQTLPSVIFLAVALNFKNQQGLYLESYVF